MILQLNPTMPLTTPHGRAGSPLISPGPQMMSLSASSLAAEKFSSWVCW